MKNIILKTSIVLLLLVFNISFAQASAVETPSANVVGGTYSATQMVSLSSTTPQADIYYTLNGNIPFVQESNPFKYNPSQPLRISSTITVTAVGRKEGMSDSPAMVQSYVMQGMQGQVSVPTSNIGLFLISDTPQATVTLSNTTPGSAIYYTTDGTRPSVYSNLYTAPFVISGIGGVMAVAVRDGWIDSDFFLNAYQLGPPVAQTIFSPGVYVTEGQLPPPDYYDAPLSITLTNATAGATINYTTDGTVPNTNSSIYTGPFTISPAVGRSSVVVKTLAVKAEMLSDEQYYTYHFRTPYTPQTSFAPGTYANGGFFVNLQGSVLNCVAPVDCLFAIHYTLDGSDPTVNSPIWLYAIAINKTTRIKAITTYGTLSSEVGDYLYTINSGVLDSVAPGAPSSLNVM